MRRTAAFFPTFLLTIGSLVLAPSGGARADSQGEGPIEIDKCQTISQPGSYRLVNNLTFGIEAGTCLSITASFVTIDLAGFAINGPAIGQSAAVAIAADADDSVGIAVKNGSIAGFSNGVFLRGTVSVVEGLRVSCRIGNRGAPCDMGIFASGIVRGNTVVGFVAAANFGAAIRATGIVTGNFMSGSASGIEAGQGSTVTGNTVVGFSGPGGGPSSLGSTGIFVDCPSAAHRLFPIGAERYGLVSLKSSMLRQGYHRRFEEWTNRNRPRPWVLIMCQSAGATRRIDRRTTSIAESG
jgi:hypothetical protein